MVTTLLLAPSWRWTGRVKTALGVVESLKSSLCNGASVPALCCEFVSPLGVCVLAKTFPYRFFLPWPNDTVRIFLFFAPTYLTSCQYYAKYKFRAVFL